MRVKTNDKIGVICCDGCGYPQVTYNVDILRSKKPHDIIYSADFSHVMDSTKLSDNTPIKCTKCNKFYSSVINRHWRQLRDGWCINEWDVEENE